MIVKVTQEHIDKGLWRQSCHCPVALALKDAFKVKVAKVDYRNFEIGLFPYDNLIFSCPVPTEIIANILDYDMKCKMEPFEFELSLEGVKL